MNYFQNTIRVYRLGLFVIHLGFASLFISGCCSYQNTTLRSKPALNPWETIAEMPSNLGRFTLAGDKNNIYRVGGVSYNIMAGGSYSQEFWAFAPTKNQWERLPDVPFGTGGMLLAYAPERDYLVAIAGISRLGDSFNHDGFTVGKYEPGKKTWTQDTFSCPGLGKPSCLMHVGKGRFLVLGGESVALLDLDKNTIKIIGSYPISGRTLGVAKVKKTFLVLQGESYSPTTLHKFDARNGRYLGHTDTSEELFWNDKLFEWRNSLFVWKNSSPTHSTEYTHSSRLLRVDPENGSCTELHPEYPGPQARRSTDGIVWGNSFYVFGGQRKDSDWLKDAYQYHFLLTDRYFTLAPNQRMERQQQQTTKEN